MPPINLKLIKGYEFGISYSRDPAPDNAQFKLHNHNDVYEVVLFTNGDAEYHAEGNVYTLKPYDIMMARPGEMHHIVCVSKKPYERYVLYISGEYFIKNNCADFTAVFENRALGENNLIPSETVMETLIEPFNKVYKYTMDKNYIVANAALIEFLYLLNNTEQNTSGAVATDKRVSAVIKYINEHLSEPFKLEELADKFYVDKFHLCRIFKKSTGYTLSRYINYKRLLKVRELHAQGQTLLEASINAGFNNYSHFYRMYKRQNGESPSGKK